MTVKKCLDGEWLRLLDRVRLVGSLPVDELPDPELFGAELGAVTHRLVASGEHALEDLLMEFADAFPPSRRPMVTALVPVMVTQSETARAIVDLHRSGATHAILSSGVSRRVLDTARKKTRQDVS